MDPLTIAALTALISGVVGTGAAYGTNRVLNRVGKKNSNNPIDNIGQGQPQNYGPGITNQQLPNGGNALTFNRFSPEQIGAQNFALGKGRQGLENLNLDFGPIAQQARTNYAQQTIPSILARFAGQRSRGGSDLNHALSQAGAGLETDLASLGSQYNLQSADVFNRLLGTGLTPQFDSIYTPKAQRQPSGFENAAVASAPYATEALIKAAPELFKYIMEARAASKASTGTGTTLPTTPTNTSGTGNTIARMARG
jgi:hypothetical protein